MAATNKGFFNRVYDVVAAIPAGKVMTYGQIAARLGGFYSGRTVGFAMRAAPHERNLPCHRVVNKKGEMAPDYCFGGAARQRALLKKEGVFFKKDGCIDMKRSQWEPGLLPPPKIAKRVQENRRPPGRMKAAE